MTQNEYALSKQRLEEQRRAGVELVEKAYEAQMRALELVWMLQGGTGPTALPAGAVAVAPAPPAPLPPPAKPRHKKGPEVEEEIDARLSELPAVFTRHDVCRVLGYEPDRAVLLRVLQKLARDEIILVEDYGSGRKPARYRKPGTGPSPEAV